MVSAEVIRSEGEDKIRFRSSYRTILTEGEVKEIINALQFALKELEAVKAQRERMIKNPEMRGRYLEYERYIKSCDELTGDDIRKARDLTETMFYELERQLEENDGKSVKGLDSKSLVLSQRDGSEYNNQTVQMVLRDLKKIGIARNVPKGNGYLWYLSMYGQYMEA